MIHVIAIAAAISHATSLYEMERRRLEAQRRPLLPPPPCAWCGTSDNAPGHNCRNCGAPSRTPH